VVVMVGMYVYPIVKSVSWYQLETSVRSLRALMDVTEQDIMKCVEAHEFLMEGTMQTTDSQVITEHIKNLYAVLNQLLAVVDIEKLYIPPLLDDTKGLYDNQLLLEQAMARELNVSQGDRVLDVGCGRGRIAHHVATLTGASVSGFNIDLVQIDNAIEYAAATGMENRLDFAVADHHGRFPYEDEQFDAVYSVQALWPFFKVKELDGVARELYRVTKPGGLYTCSEYLLTPHFDWTNPTHKKMHDIFIPTLMASHSNYPADVVGALERAGFEKVVSEPALAPTWPLCDQKTELFKWMRSFVRLFTRVGLCPPWMERLINNLLKGGREWTLADRASLADLNWHITVRKPTTTTTTTTTTTSL